MSAKSYDFKEVGRCMRVLRQSHGWTQAELAAKANRSISTISALERGERDMSINTFLVLCRTLECLPSALLGNQ